MSTTPIALGSPSTAGIETYVVSGRCAWWVPVDGVVVGVVQGASVTETLPGTFLPMMPV